MTSREGNVFSHIYASFCPRRGRVPHASIIHGALDLTPPPDMRPHCTLTPPLYRGIWWLATETCTVGKPAVRILLEYASYKQ